MLYLSPASCSSDLLPLCFTATRLLFSLSSNARCACPLPFSILFRFAWLPFICYFFELLFSLRLFLPCNATTHSNLSPSCLLHSIPSCSGTVSCQSCRRMAWRRHGLQVIAPVCPFPQLCQLEKDCARSHFATSKGLTARSDQADFPLAHEEVQLIAKLKAHYSLCSGCICVTTVSVKVVCPIALEAFYFYGKNDNQDDKDEASRIVL